MIHFTIKMENRSDKIHAGDCLAGRRVRSFIFIYKFTYFNWRLITLQYCIGFAIHQHVSARGIHVFPILNLPPSSLPIPSIWVVPVHQPQASSIMHRTWTGNSFHIWYYTFQCWKNILKRRERFKHYYVWIEELNIIL